MDLMSWPGKGSAGLARWSVFQYNVLQGNINRPCIPYRGLELAYPWSDAPFGGIPAAALSAAGVEVVAHLSHININLWLQRRGHTRIPERWFRQLINM